MAQKKKKHGNYTDKPRYKVIYDYEGDFKEKYEKSTIGMVKEIMKVTKSFLK